MTGTLKKVFYSFILMFAGILLLSFRAQAADPALPTEPDRLGLKQVTYTVEKGSSRSQIQAILDKALEQPDCLTVIQFQPGTYTLDTGLAIHSNTYLKLDANTTIKSEIKKDGMPMLSNHDRNVEGSIGHNMSKNIFIDGGVWDANAADTTVYFNMIGITHAQNVIIRNVTMKNSVDHMLNLSGSAKVLVEKSTFADSKKLSVFKEGYFEKKEADSTETTKEMRYMVCEVIHLDITNPEGEPGGYCSDGTPPENVTIRNCTFKNVSCGIGTHHVVQTTNTSAKNYAKDYVNNISIKNNTFTNLHGPCINAVSFKNTTVSGNTATNCGNFMYIQNTTGLSASGTNKVTGIWGGSNPYEQQQISILDSKSITLDGLTLTGKSGDTSVLRNNLWIKGSDGVTLSNSTLSACYEYPVRAEASKNISVKKSSLSSSHGTCYTVGSAVTISDSTLSGQTYFNSKSTGTLTGNTIKNDQVLVGGDSTLTAKNNTLSGQSGMGFLCMNATGEISGNTISNTPSHAIHLDNCKNFTISNNKISGAKAIPIRLANCSSVAIRSNTISLATNSALSLNNSTGITVSGIDSSKIYNNNSSYTIVKEPVSGGQWKQSGSLWWYRHADGSYTKNNWEAIDGKWYYFNGSGYMVTGWKAIGGKWYYFGSSGAMATGWQAIGGKWYYFGSSGVMTTGWQAIGGKWYYFGGSGAMATGWQAIGGKWYYFGGSGVMATGWQAISGKWYYFGGSGVMATGWQAIGGKWYYFGSSGAMATGWQAIGGKWYYFGSSGAMVTGWQTIGGKTYYFNSSGAMAVNTVIDGVTVGGDGVRVNAEAGSDLTEPTPGISDGSAAEEVTVDETDHAE